MTTARPMRRRAGFTLTEMMIAMLIMGIIGAAATRLLVGQSRFFDQQTNVRTARRVSRSAMNLMLSDLRMVQDSGGVTAAAANGKSITVTVPYRYGLLCKVSALQNTASMLPIDSATQAMSTYSGFAWRDSTHQGRYVVVTPLTPTGADKPITSPFPADCTGSGAGQANLRTVSTNGRTGEILAFGSPTVVAAPVGTPIFFWEQVTYSFAASTLFPGKIGLWRNVQYSTQGNEEIMAPFDTSARFKFYAPGEDSSRTSPPSLDRIRGLDIVLTGQSDRGVSNNPNPTTTKLVTSVFFKNVRAY